MPKTFAASISMSGFADGSKAVSGKLISLFRMASTRHQRRGRSGQAGGAQHSIGLNHLFQTLFGAPVAAICVGMEPFHKFLIPRLDLDQGGVVRQLQRVHRGDLKPRQLAFRAARLAIFIVLAEYRMAVMKMRGALTGPDLGAAPAQRPGGAVAENRFLAELFDIAVVHALEEIPCLVVRPGMGGAEEKIVGKILARFRHPAITRFRAILDRAGTRLAFGFWRRHILLDADVAFEARAGLRHDASMGAKRLKTKKTYRLTLAGTSPLGQNHERVRHHTG